MGDQIVYADATGKYVLVGSMLDTENKENLTNASMNDRGRIDFKTLPVKQAIKVVKGNGSRVFAVFSDPDCPYCQQLEKSLLSVNDYTMYVYLFPIATLHPQAPVKAHAIWCAPDRAQAWRDWMQDEEAAADEDLQRRSHRFTAEARRHPAYQQHADTLFRQWHATRGRPAGRGHREEAGGEIKPARLSDS